jgi:hypothetical protein
MELEADFFRERAHRGRVFLRGTFVVGVEGMQGQS